MFQFAGFPSMRYGFAHGCAGASRAGFPIQTPADRRACAPPRSFSQLAASFFGSQCQGIRPAPFLFWPFPPSFKRRRAAAPFLPHSVAGQGPPFFWRRLSPSPCFYFLRFSCSRLSDVRDFSLHRFCMKFSRCVADALSVRRPILSAAGIPGLFLPDPPAAASRFRLALPSRDSRFLFFF